MADSKLTLYINGSWNEAHGSYFESNNPCDGTHPWSGNSANASDIDQAIKSARKAFTKWADFPFEKREELLRHFSEVVKEKREWIAEAISLEVGKPKWEALGEVDGVIGKVDLSIQAYNERCAEVSRGVATTRFKPHGVAVVVGAFNFPAHITHGHIIPSLLAGNTVIFKPSRETALVGERLLTLWDKIKLPAGVINLIQGETETASILSTHKDIDALFFTGSTRVGLLLNEHFAKHPNKMLALEMGGNNPLVIHDIENVDAAVYQVIQSAYVTAGQRCTCARRLILTNFTKKEAFLEKLCSMIKTIKVGAPHSTPEPFMGPVISNGAADHILHAQTNLLKNGGRALVEIKRLEADKPFLTPGLIDVTELRDHSDEEVFGPLLQIKHVANLDDAITEANNTRYGLTAGILCDRLEDYEKFRKSVKAGIINWNQQTTGASGAAPFGGVGFSGNHRPTGYYASDYCSYPVASIEHKKLVLPEKRSPGLSF